MKKTLILLSSFALLVGGALSQVNRTSSLVNAEPKMRKLNLATTPVDAEAKKQKDDGVAKVGGTVIWKETFGTGTAETSKVVDANGDPLGAYTNFAWTVDNSGQTGVQYGWNIDETNSGWWNTATLPFGQPATGNFAEMHNGNPQTGVETQALGVTYMLTSGAINFQTLTSSKALTLQFMQTGALFNDNSDVELSVDGGATWTKVYRNRDHKNTYGAGSPTSDQWPARDIVSIDIQPNLEAAASVTDVRIRFVWTTAFPAQAANKNVWVTYGWYIDDITIEEKPAVDIATTYEVKHFDHFTYSKIPTTQAANMKLSTRVGVQNMGASTLTNVKFDVLDASSSTVGTSNTISLVPTARDTLNITDLTTPGASLTDIRIPLPTTVGTHTFKRVVSMTENPDANPTNNVVGDIKFEITDNVYAVDDGVNYSEFPYRTMQASDSDTPYKLVEVGNLYKIYTDQTLYGVDIRYFEKQAKDKSEVVVVLYKYIEQPLDLISMAESEPYFIPTNKSVAGIHSIPFTIPQPLEAGSTYLIMVRPAYPADIFLSASGQMQHNNQYVAPANGGAGFDGMDIDTRQSRFLTDQDQLGGFLDMSIPVIRMNFSSTIPPIPVKCTFTGALSTICVDDSLLIKVNDPSGNGTWESTDGEVIDVDGGKITPLKAGTSTISYTPHLSTSACVEKVERVITVVTSGQACEKPGAGVNDLDEIADVAIFPNPSTDHVNVEFTLQNSETVYVEVIDMTGKIVATQTIKNATAGTNSVSFNTADYARGIYSVAIKTADAVSTHKLVKH